MSELRTLIDLCPGIRLPQNEPEIFSDLALAEYYLYKLCEHYDWYMDGDSVPGMAYFYARNVMDSRWSEAEHVIATDPGYAYNYTIGVMKFRWPEAEHIIATDPNWAYTYAKYVMKSRWPEAEAVIATDDMYRRWYNNIFGTKL